VPVKSAVPEKKHQTGQTVAVLSGHSLQCVVRPSTPRLLAWSAFASLSYIVIVTAIHRLGQMCSLAAVVRVANPRIKQNRWRSHDQPTMIEISTKAVVVLPKSVCDLQSRALNVPTTHRSVQNYVRTILVPSTCAYFFFLSSNFREVKMFHFITSIFFLIEKWK